MVSKHFYTFLVQTVHFHQIHISKTQTISNLHNTVSKCDPKRTLNPICYYLSQEMSEQKNLRFSYHILTNLGMTTKQSLSPLGSSFIPRCKSQVISLVVLRKTGFTTQEVLQPWFFRLNFAELALTGFLVALMS